MTLWGRVKPYLLLVLVVVAGLLMLVLTFGRNLASLFVKKPLPPDQPSDKQKKIEEQTEKEKKELFDGAEKKVVEVQERHAEVVQDLVEDQEDRYEELKDDPEALNAWLLEVGKKTRPPQ